MKKEYNLLVIYYACILGLIRFLGIGVGNEHSKAASFMAGVVSMFIASITKVFGFDIKNLGSFLLVILLLSIFFIIYFVASSLKGSIRVNKWLSNNSKKKKWLIGLSCVIFTLCTTILFLKTNAPG